MNATFSESLKSPGMTIEASSKILLKSSKLLLEENDDALILGSVESGNDITVNAGDLIYGELVGTTIMVTIAVIHTLIILRTILTILFLGEDLLVITNMLFPSFCVHEHYGTVFDSSSHQNYEQSHQSLINAPFEEFNRNKQQSVNLSPKN